MDKYEFNIKVEQIKKLVNKGDYETAMKIADSVDWRRVRSTSLLTLVSQVYERNAEYQDAKDILLLAFERAPMGKGLLFKLTDLALREGDVQEAEAYYREFCDLAGDDPRQNLLRFLILEAKEAPLDQQIHSLERYCEEELDEKWLYHLAELYQQAGQEDKCVQICDKIMLMFGLGKYVDKAMELKLQFAPLTKYQMDLVENREKYEEKLRAVEEEYRDGRYRPAADEEYYDSEDETAEEVPELDEQDEEGERAFRREEDADEDEALMASIHEAKAEEELAREMSRLDSYEEEEEASGGETRVLTDLRELTAYKERVRREEADYEAKEERRASEFAEAETAASWEPEEEQADEGEDDADLEETEIEDWDLEPELQGSNHLMIEAADPERGLAFALESLKKIHRELGTKASVAKISGEKLNRRGVLAVEDRLAGKDLLVERAADLSAVSIDELNQLMGRDETGIIVVLVDTPSRMERLHNAFPALAERFQYIGCEESEQSGAAALQAAGKNAEGREDVARRQAEEEAEEARRREEEIRYQAEREAMEAARRRAEEEAEAARRQAEEEAEEARRREEEIRYQAEREAMEEARRRAEEEAEAARRQAEEEAEEARRREEEIRYQAEREAMEAARRQAEEEAMEAARRQAELEAEEARRQEEYEEQERRRAEEEDARRQAQYEEGEEEPGEYEAEGAYEDRADDGSEMDVEEFAQYACKYASEIDCSISGKSMLALYERAEMMEEDGIPLTKTSAEDLIEEAADKAEKKSFGGLFTSKYDKDGLLILKEKHFFD